MARRKKIEKGEDLEAAERRKREIVGRADKR